MYVCVKITFQFFCGFDNTNLCTCHMCVSVWMIHSASMSTQQVSFPDSPVRRWFFFWEASPQWHQLPPTHQPSPWHHTKTFLAMREGEHHAWHIYRRGLCFPLLLYPPSPYFLFSNRCLYSRLLCLPEYQRAFLTSLAIVPWAGPALCFSLPASLSLSLSIPLMATAIHLVHLKSFFPRLLF